MSLNVTDEMAERASRGPIDRAEFIELIKTSLPRAWAVVEKLIERKKGGETGVVCYGTGPMDEETRGQLLRMMAGTAIRTSLEAHYGVALAFQNCHNVAVVKEEEKKDKDFEEFKAVESQVKNQIPKPEFQHC